MKEQIIREHKEDLVAYFETRADHLQIALEEIQNAYSSSYSAAAQEVKAQIINELDTAADHLKAVRTYFAPLPMRPSRTQEDAAHIRREQLETAYAAYLVYDAAHPDFG